MKKSVFRPRLSLFRGGRASAVTGGMLLAGAALTQGCLQRDIVKQDPNTSNVYVGIVRNDKIEEIDLLFVIDNSVSMADKQDILELAVPQMVTRLVNPQCVNSAGDAEPAADDGSCPTGFAPEFEAVNNIHIGVITSSLGGHGSAECPRVQVDEAGVANNKDDRAHLMPSVRPDLNLSDPTGNGFLEWNGGGLAERTALEDAFESHVVAADERGCGFEAPLEAWYRFLVDPNPPEQIVLGGADMTEAMMSLDENGMPDIDDTVMAQRAAFLRPKSLVAIVLLSDENDCSAMDGGAFNSNSRFGWLVAEASRPMLAAPPMCDQNPNDACCFSCLANSAPAGCGDKASLCAEGNLPPEEDRANVRCFENKRRFGVDLLYPTDRYVDGLTKGVIRDWRTNTDVENPLLRGASPTNKVNRGTGLVFFAGIVGIPWQDVATPESLPLDNDVMEYLTFKELNTPDPDLQVSRWDIILGKPNLPANSHLCAVTNPPESCGKAPEPPLDPFMIESIVPRDTSLSNPITGDMIVGTASDNPRANNINGHEAQHDVIDPRLPGGAPANDDLQYACIFPLTNPKLDCSPMDASCDCGTEPLRNSPLCQPVGGGDAGTTQYWGKAYPGTRILQVLHDFGDNSIVGSICPKVTTPPVTAPAFGYNPAVQAIVDRLKEKLGGKCLPRELSTNEDGSVPCAVIEALALDQGTLNCDPGEGREPVTDLATEEAVIKQLRAAEICDGISSTPCEDFRMCKINEIIENEPGREECLYDKAYSDNLPKGFCYVDPGKEVEDAEGNISYPAGGPRSGEDPATFVNPLVESCPATQRRLLRFVGKGTPAADSITLVACSGDAASVDAPIPPPPVAVVPEPEPEN